MAVNIRRTKKNLKKPPLLQVWKMNVMYSMMPKDCRDILWNCLKNLEKEVKTIKGRIHRVISWNMKYFYKYFYFGIQHSLRMFLINKKIVFTEKRYRVKFNSIKKYLLLIKQKQKNSKIPKRIWMKPCSKTRSDKSTCANIFLELPLTI